MARRTVLGAVGGGRELWISYVRIFSVFILVSCSENINNWECFLRELLRYYRFLSLIQSFQAILEIEDRVFDQEFGIIYHSGTINQVLLFSISFIYLIMFSIMFIVLIVMISD